MVDSKHEVEWQVMEVMGFILRTQERWLYDMYCELIEYLVEHKELYYCTRIDLLYYVVF